MPKKTKWEIVVKNRPNLSETRAYAGRVLSAKKNRKCALQDVENRGRIDVAHSLCNVCFTLEVACSKSLALWNPFHLLRLLGREFAQLCDFLHGDFNCRLDSVFHRYL